MIATRCLGTASTFSVKFSLLNWVINTFHCLFKSPAYSTDIYLFIYSCDLFIEDVCISKCVMSSGKVINKKSESKREEKEASWLDFKYCVCVYLGVPRETPEESLGLSSLRSHF
jgi:hypothetical protein